MAIAKSMQAGHHDSRKAFVPKDLYESQHVFIRNDAVKKPLTPTYDGPYLVEKRIGKYFQVNRNGTKVNISVDRLKPAYIHSNTMDKTTKAAGQCQPMEPEESKEKQYVTRGGRKVIFRKP